MCVCAVNGTAVKGHSKQEAGENRLHKRPESTTGKKEEKRKMIAAAKGPGESVSVARLYICNEKCGAPCHPSTQIWS